MEKANKKGLFTTVMVLKRSLEKLKDINNQEVEDKQETVPQWKTLDNLISEKHKKAIK
jgi:hypothetical protein